MFYKGKKRDEDVSKIQDCDFHGHGDLIREEVSERITEAVRGTADPSGGLKVLDVGTGYGKTAALLANVINEKSKIWTIDPSSDVLENARNVLKEKGLEKRLEFVQASAEDLHAFDSEFFDIIVSVMVLHHIVALRPALKEMERVLKSKKGRIILSDWSHEAHELPFESGHKHEDFFGLKEINEEIKGLELTTTFSKEFDYWYIVELTKS